MPMEEKHPHARGEDLDRALDVDETWETPPRTWGRRQLTETQQKEWGNTPTHVGKTRKGTGGRCGRWKHPHARGEDIVPVRLRSWKQETPPRTWGRRLIMFSGRTCTGNTPTHVGKTNLATSHIDLSWKHPHARGEDELPLPSELPAEETPPRTWGRLSRKTRGGKKCRNTPTHVGKTNKSRLKRAFKKKHPHARGED